MTDSESNYHFLIIQIGCRFGYTGKEVLVGGHKFATNSLCFFPGPSYEFDEFPHMTSRPSPCQPAPAHPTSRRPPLPPTTPRTHPTPPLQWR